MYHNDVNSIVIFAVR